MSSHQDVQISPAVNKPFLEAFKIQHGDPAVLGRFFLKSVEIMRTAGIELSFGTCSELTALYEREQANWPFFIPTFDPRISNVPLEDTCCIEGRNSDGDVVVTVASRKFEASHRSFADVVASGDFFSIRPTHNPDNIVARITAPSASILRANTITYVGSMWVRPDYRHHRFAGLFVHLMAACNIAIWNAEVVTGFLREAEIGSALHHRYGFAHHEPSFIVSRNGTDYVNAQLVWGTQNEMLGSISQYLARPTAEVDRSVGRRDGQKDSAVG